MFFEIALDLRLKANYGVRYVKNALQHSIV